MSLDERIIKKEELEERKLYLICPDKECNIYDISDNPHYECRYNCPKESLAKKVIKCNCCNEPVYLPLDHSAMRRIDTHSCKDGKTPILLIQTIFLTKIYDIIG